MLANWAIKRTTQTGHSFISTVSRPEQVRRPGAGDKLEALEPFHAYQALQDGRYPCLDLLKTGVWKVKIDIKDDYFNAYTSVAGQSFPQVLAQRPDLPVKVLTILSNVPFWSSPNFKMRQW